MLRIGVSVIVYRLSCMDAQHQCIEYRCHCERSVAICTWDRDSA